MLTKNIQVIGIKMCRIDKLLSVVESRRIVCNGLQFLAVDFYLLFKIIFLAEQTVMQFHQQQERDKGDCRDAADHQSAFTPEVDNTRNSGCKKYQP